MSAARWTRASATRVAGATLLAALSGAGLTGCAGIPYAAQGGPPVTAPVGSALAGQPAEGAEPCPFLGVADVTALAGDQRTTLNGSVNACTFSIGSQFTYQINVVPNDAGRFQANRDSFFADSADVTGVGDEAFLSEGSGITTLGARQGDTFFTVALVPAVADTNKPRAAAAPAAAADPDASAAVDADGDGAVDADVDGDGVVDADADGDGLVDEDAPAAAVDAADADGDGEIDEDLAAAVAAAADAVDGAAAGTGPLTDITDAKARLVDVARTVAGNL
jgi:hypothetical protein